MGERECALWLIIARWAFRVFFFFGSGVGRGEVD